MATNPPPPTAQPAPLQKTTSGPSRPRQRATENLHSPPLDARNNPIAPRPRNPDSANDRSHVRSQGAPAPRSALRDGGITQVGACSCNPRAIPRAGEDAVGRSPPRVQGAAGREGAIRRRWVLRPRPRHQPARCGVERLVNRPLEDRCRLKDGDDSGLRREGAGPRRTSSSSELFGVADASLGWTGTGGPSETNGSLPVEHRTGSVIGWKRSSMPSRRSGTTLPQSIASRS